MESFQSLLDGTQSNDQAARQYAETQILALIQTDPIQAIEHLQLSIRDPRYDKLALVLFRRFFVHSHTFASLPLPTQSALTATLYALIAPEAPLSTLKLAGEILVSIAAERPQGGFFQSLAQWISQPALQEFGLYVLELASAHDSLLVTLKENLAGLLQTLASCMESQDTSIALSAISALCSIISEVQVSTQGIPGRLLITLTGCFAQSSPAKLISALKSLSDLTEAAPKFWKDDFRQLVATLASIAAASSVDLEVRQASVQLVTTLILKAPLFLNTSQESVRQICAVATSLIQEQEETLGKQLLEAASCNLDSSGVYAIVRDVIPTSTDLRAKNTSLVVLGVVCRGCAAQIRANLTETVNGVLSYMSEPQLVGATMDTLREFFETFSPSVQEQMHARVVPSIISALGSAQQSALNALISYAKGIVAADTYDSSLTFDQYSLGILTVLVQLLDSSILGGDNARSKLVLDALSISATTLKAGFARYYPEIAPGLIRLVRLPVSTGQQEETRAEAIRCIGHVVESLRENPGGFIEDVRALLQFLLELRREIPEGPSVLAIVEVLPQFADVLGGEFTQCLDGLLGQLLGYVLREVDVTIADLGSGSQQVVVNNEAFHFKLKACRVLFDLMSVLKERFSPYVDRSLDVLIQVMLYPYSAQVRKTSIKAMVATLGCSEDATLFGRLTGVFLEGLEGPLLPSDSRNFLRGLLGCFEMVEDPPLDEAPRISECLAVQLQRAAARSQSRETERASCSPPELHKEQLETLGALAKVDHKIIRLTMEFIGLFLRHFGKQYAATFRGLFFDYFRDLLLKGRLSHDELLSSICVFDDYVEHVNDCAWTNGKSFIIEALLAHCDSSNAEIRQSAVYGLGVAAMHAGGLFEQYRQASVLKVRGAIVKSPEFAVASDCAVGALGKLALYQDAGQLEFWVSLLPLSAECEEDRSVHRLFLENYGRVKKCAAARRVVSALNQLAGSEFLDEESCAMLERIS